MASGSRGFKDFGLSSNLTLPITNASSIEPDPKVLAQHAFMPEEREQKSKKHARFAPEREVQAKVQRKPSWFRRLFRRSKKSDKSAPYVMTREDEDEALVKVVRSGSDPELSGSKRDRLLEGEAKGEAGQLQRRKQRSDKSSRQTKALSTAFEHITTTAEQGHTPSAVEVVFKPPTSSTRKVVLQYRAGSKDGLGLLLSGGLAPVTVTRVKPGGQAELAGIGIGDTILEVDGINCRKKLEASQFAALKALVQRSSPAGDRAAERDLEEAARGKRKVIQKDLESETSAVKITQIDSSGPEEDAAPPQAAEVKLRKNKKKRLSSTRASGEYGNPLAASSPVKEPSVENDGKLKKKKKASNRASINAGEETVGSDDTKRNSTANDGGKANSSSRKAASSSATATATEEDKTSPKKRKKKKTTKGAEASLIENSARSPSRSSEVSKTSLSSKMSSPDVKTVQAEINDPRIEDSHIPPQNESLSVDEVDGSYNVDRSARHRRSSSPKSRYRMGDSESPTEEQGQPEKVTVGVFAKEKEPQKVKKKAKASEKKKKRKKSKEPSSRKVSKEQPQTASSKEQSSSRKVSAASKGQAATETPAEEEEPCLEPVSAAISGSIESNTLTFVSKEGRHSPGEQDVKRNANTLPRAKSAGHSRSTQSSAEASVNHSTSSSISNLREETEKKFRSELREARRSQHDMPEAINSSLTIEIDPNIKVKKSGQVKGKTPVRPSIFNQSSSPEPEDAAPISSGAVEDNILDSELKVKKSGLMVGRKTSATSRPSILDEKQTENRPSDIQPGEMKYNRKVSETVDLSSVPEIAPILGVVAGRDRRDASNRSLNKQRPATERQSLLLDSKENEIMGTERVDLSQMKGGRGDGKATGAGGGSRLAAARKLFESNGQQDSGQQHYSKSSPVKARLPADGSEDSAGTPSWIAIAQGRQKKSTFTEKEANAPVKTPAPTAVPVTNNSKESLVPPKGQVAQRLAMFQKS